MRKRKIYNFDEYTIQAEKKKAIKEKLNEAKAERELKKIEAKELTAEIRTLKRQLKSVTKRIG